MNIFLLDTDVDKCAQYHCDKHIVKMPIEYAQLLSSVLISRGLNAPYKETHKNHPCAIWARKYEGNYTWLYDLAIAVGKEYTNRYGKVHKSTLALLDIPRKLSNDPKNERSPLPNCTTIKDYYPNLNLVDKYRLYYLRDKANILTYKNSQEPWWMGDRFYRQQLETIGSCPGSTKKAKSRVTKEDLLVSIPVPGLSKLLVSDVEKLTSITKFPKLDTPTGRLKAPYVAQLHNISSEITWTKLTVADMLQLIEYINSV